MNKILFIAITLLALTGCNSHPQTQEQVTEQKTENALEYQYEPVVSTLNGKLTTHVYWGPPGYGQDTTVDEKEKEYVLILSKAIRMKKPVTDISDGYDAATSDITQIQLVHQNPLEQYLNKQVTVSGTLFGAQTGHHHTDILLDLVTIE